MARTLGLATPSGALVADLWPTGSAARAGLKQADVVTAVDGRPVADASGVNYAISNHRPGDTVKLGVRRGGAELQIDLRAESAPATPARDERTIAGRNPFEGATVVNLSPAVADELGVDPFSGSGVLVTKLARGFAMEAGLQPGDFIRQVNNRKIASVADLTAALQGGGAVWQITIERRGQQITGTFRV